MSSAHYLHGLKDAQLLAPAQIVIEQTLTEPFPSRWQQTGTFELHRTARLDGLCIWHDLLLAGDEVYSNSPVQPGATWGQIVLPVPEPGRVACGDRLSYVIEFDAAFDQGLWKWEIEWTPADGARLSVSL